MTDTPRLIERAFRLKQASLDSVHEKNVRGGDIWTMQIGPASRVASLGAGRNERYESDMCAHNPDSWAQGEGRP